MDPGDQMWRLVMEYPATAYLNMTTGQGQLIWFEKNEYRHSPIYDLTDLSMESAFRDFSQAYGLWLRGWVEIDTNTHEFQEVKQHHCDPEPLESRYDFNTISRLEEGFVAAASADSPEEARRRFDSFWRSRYR